MKKAENRGMLPVEDATRNWTTSNREYAKKLDEIDKLRQHEWIKYARILETKLQLNLQDGETITLRKDNTVEITIFSPIDDETVRTLQDIGYDYLIYHDGVMCISIDFNKELTEENNISNSD